MSHKLRVSPCEDIPLTRATLPGSIAARLYWLGQAGFLVDTHASRLVIDPYLSDSLAGKYRGKKFPHIRMMPSPVGPGELKDVDWVLSTHAHTDHLDPGTLPFLASANPSCRFLVARSAKAKALERGVPAERMLLCNTSETLELSPESSADTLSVTVLPAAHESREYDEQGNDRYLGFAIRIGQTTLYHCGDTVPFPALRHALSAIAVNVALFPVNGRDEKRIANGVPGNMTLEEAISLADEMEVDAMIGHHFDLFDFNTIDRAWGERLLSQRKPRTDEQYLLARSGVCYDVLEEQTGGNE